MNQIWWDRVPNAVSYVQNIVESLLKESSVLLQYAENIPWREYWIESIKEAVVQYNSSKRFEMIEGVENPGEYILREYCKPEKRATYRPTKSYAKFFAQSDDIVLNERYLWVKVSSKEGLATWMRFVSEYVKERGKGKDSAVFILEWKSKTPAPNKKGLQILSFDDYISEYDRNVFTTLASSSVREPAFIKSYLAELSAITFENDIELCAACLNEYKAFLDCPNDLICKVLAEQTRCSGEMYTFEKPPEAINNGIWKAQIAIVYPLIEEFREDFVRVHAKPINAELPIQSAYGEMYENPKDVELGTLVFMAGSKRLIISTEEYKKLDKFRIARNKLAHLDTLDFSELCELYR